MTGRFLERSLASALTTVDRALFAEEIARQKNWLQDFDPRAKLIGILALIAAAVGIRSLPVLICLFALAVSFVATAGIPLGRIAAGIWLSVLAFTGVIAVPALFLTPGRLLAAGVTEQGLRTATMLLARAETAATLSAVLVLTTPWNHILKALRTLRVPVTGVVVLGMTYRYIFLLVHTALDMMEARRSRMMSPVSGAGARALLANSIGVLLTKSHALSADIYSAMLARGFRGEVFLLHHFRMRPADWGKLTGMVAAAVATLWWGRS